MDINGCAKNCTTASDTLDNGSFKAFKNCVRNLQTTKLHRAIKQVLHQLDQACHENELIWPGPKPFFPIWPMLGYREPEINQVPAALFRKSSPSFRAELQIGKDHKIHTPHASPAEYRQELDRSKNILAHPVARSGKFSKKSPKQCSQASVGCPGM